MRNKLANTIFCIGFLLGFSAVMLPQVVQAATFTVTETGDQGDANAGDGSCDYDGVTPGSQCMLRAAIEEANTLAGADNIHFSIPTTDPGYRDYDQPDTPSSGDAAGDDDYWTIRPGTALPDITDGVNLDGSTQATNVADSNAEGPEVEILGVNLGSAMELDFYGSTGSSINELVIANHIKIITGDNFVMTNSHFNADVKGYEVSSK